MKFPTKSFLLACGACAALSFGACADGKDTTEAVSDDIEAGADRAGDAMSEAANDAGNAMSNAGADASASINAAADRIQYEWNDESRDLYGDMREANGYMQNRMSELERDMASASAEAKAV